MASLPPYETLVRWTVADTTRWLSENGLGDYKDAFKKEGVDGSKLAKLTETDINNLKSTSSKKKNLLKNAVAAIDRSNVGSLVKVTPGMKSAMRTPEHVPPRPPRKADPHPPTNHAPPVPISHNNFDDDNEDAYSWGSEDFGHSDSDTEIVNDDDWRETDHNSNNIGYNRQTTYEDRQPAPSSESDDSEEYETPISKPHERPLPLQRKEEPPPPPRPPRRGRAPSPEEEVYEEPDEEIDRKKKSNDRRQLPPLPPTTQGQRPSIPVPTRPGKSAAPPVVQPPVEPTEEMYEQMEPPQKPKPSSVPDPPRSKSKPKPTERTTRDRPLPNVPATPAAGRSAPAPTPPPPKAGMEQYDWYHRSIDRATADKSLLEHDQDGMFLIRESKRGGREQQYTLMIYKTGRVYNLPIRKRARDNKFALGVEKPNELEFVTVQDLVDYFRTNRIKLNQTGSTQLKLAMPK